MSLKFLRNLLVTIEFGLLILTSIFAMLGFKVFALVTLGVWFINLAIEYWIEYSICQVDYFVNISCMLIADGKFSELDMLKSRLSKLQLWIFNQRKEV